mmetsp:Transcript_64959/g.194213  ORF Transcript_64959/g.194213 Transcript_64959/m.194213 type:complete len:362 (+) Transcript_64959:1694-2779(+)
MLEASPLCIRHVRPRLVALARRLVAPDPILLRILPHGRVLSEDLPQLVVGVGGALLHQLIDEPLHLPKVEARRARRVELRHALFHPALVHAQIRGVEDEPHLLLLDGARAVSVTHLEHVDQPLAVRRARQRVRVELDHHHQPLQPAAHRRVRREGHRQPHHLAKVAVDDTERRVVVERRGVAAGVLALVVLGELTLDGHRCQPLHPLLQPIGSPALALLRVGVIGRHVHAAHVEDLLDQNVALERPAQRRQVGRQLKEPPLELLEGDPIRFRRELAVRVPRVDGVIGLELLETHHLPRHHTLDERHLLLRQLLAGVTWQLDLALVRVLALHALPVDFVDEEERRHDERQADGDRHRERAED